MRPYAWSVIAILCMCATARAQSADEYVKGGCQIRVIRKSSVPRDGVESKCTDVDAWNKPGAQDAAKLHLWALPFMHLAYDTAELAMCGAKDCATKQADTQVRIIIVGDAFPFAQNQKLPNDEGGIGSIDFVISTGFIDFVDNTAAALMHETVLPWLKQMPGRSCTHAMPSSHEPADSAQGLTGKIPAVAAGVYIFMMAHELAHVKKATCGASDSQVMSIEQACDAKAFDKLTALKIQTVTGLSPAVTSVVFVVLDHYLTWQAETYAKRKNFGLVDMLPPMKWNDRNRALLARWASFCKDKPSTSQAAATCYEWKKLSEYIDDLLDLPLPAACPASSITPTALQSISAGTGSTNAARCIREVDTGRDWVTWHQDASHPFVDLDLTYGNVCPQDVQCNIVFASGTVPRARSDSPDWKAFASAVDSLRIASHSEAQFKRSLQWYATKEEMPSVRVPRPPRDNMNLLSCSFSNEAAETQAMVENGSANWCVALSTALAASPTFSSIQGPVESRDIDTHQIEDYYANLSFTGAPCTIDRYGDSRRLTCSLGRTDADYTSAVSKVKKCLGTGWKADESERTSSTARTKEVELSSGDDKPQITVHLRTPTDTRRAPTVVLQVSPP